ASDVNNQSAKTRVGRSYTLGQVFSEIEKDLVFFESTNGGITFSGGEPTFQLEFLEQLVGFCESKGIHTILETCGYFQYDIALPVLKKIDLIFYDIKAADAEIHKELTGRANEKIIKNLKHLYSAHPNILVRYVSVPELNSQSTHLNHLAKLLKKLDIPEVSILKYNPLWVDKTRNIEGFEPSVKKYTLKEIDSCWENSIRILKQQGLRIVNTP
ncbi:radical SAM protein, partial [bacterium]|nr:radical SAM protein [bacterium]